MIGVFQFDRAEQGVLAGRQVQILGAARKSAVTRLDRTAGCDEHGGGVRPEHMGERLDGILGRHKTLVTTHDQRGGLARVQHKALALAGQQHDPEAAIETQPVDAEFFRGTGFGDPGDMRARRRAFKRGKTGKILDGLSGEKSRTGGVRPQDARAIRRPEPRGSRVGNKLNQIILGGQFQE